MWCVSVCGLCVSLYWCKYVQVYEGGVCMCVVCQFVCCVSVCVCVFIGVCKYECMRVLCVCVWCVILCVL